MIEKISEPGFDIENLSLEDKIKLVRESGGLLVDILKGETIDWCLMLKGCFIRSPSGWVKNIG